MKLNKEQRQVLVNKIADNILNKNQKLELTNKEKTKVLSILNKDSILPELVELRKSIDKVYPTLHSIENVSKKNDLYIYYSDPTKALDNLKQIIAHKEEMLIEDKAIELGYIKKINREDLLQKIENELILSSIECDNLKDLIDRITKEITKQILK